MTSWDIIEEALAHKRPPRNLTWLAEQLRVSVQVIQNWKSRRVPPSRFREVASALGLSIDQLEGLEPLPWTKEWPFSSDLHLRVGRLVSEDLAALERAMWTHLDSDPLIHGGSVNKSSADALGLHSDTGKPRTAEPDPRLTNPMSGVGAKKMPPAVEAALDVRKVVRNAGRTSGGIQKARGGRRA